MTKLKTTKYLISLFWFIVPVLVSAFTLGAQTDSNFNSVVNEIVSILSLLRPLLMGCAFLLFFWGLSLFILNSDKPEKIKDGRNYMLWGILALFILLTYGVIVQMMASEFGVDTNKPIFLPESAR